MATTTIESKYRVTKAGTAPVLADERATLTIEVTASGRWLNFVLRDQNGTPSKTYGFDRTEKRWSYGEPLPSKRIAEQAQTVVKQAIAEANTPRWSAADLREAAAELADEAGVGYRNR